MGHGIFPNYGPDFIKEVCKHLSKTEAKSVFYTSRKERKAIERQKLDEEESLTNKKKRKK